MNFHKLTKLWYILLVVPVVFMSSCKDDDPIPAVVASFQFEADADNFLLVAFTNFSQNAVSYSWNFGDTNTSTDESPSHEYDATGTYTVKLIATAEDGSTSEKTEDIEVVDPDVALTLLAGNTSKTWKLVREGASTGIGPDAANWAFWWNLTNNGTRNCVYDDEFIFSRNGGFEFKDNGTFWGEGDVYVEGSDKENLFEICFDATVENLTVDGNDLSAWLSSSSHTYTYNATDKNISLSGMGAWMGLVKLGTDGYVTTPQASTTFDIILTDGGTSGVDTLDVIFDYSAIGNYWKIRYVSYDDAGKEPAIASAQPKAIFSYVLDGPSKTVTFTNTSVESDSYVWDFGDGSATSTETNPVHTYAADGIYSVSLTATNSAGSNVKIQSVSVNVAGLEDINFDFESDELSWSIFGGTDFAGAGMSLAKIVNPNSSGINTSGFVMQIDQEASVQGWSGISTTLAGRVDFTNKKTFKVKVWSPVVGQIVKFKLEYSGDANNNKEIDATTTVANEWEELTFTFEVDDSGKWDLLVLFFDFQTDLKGEATTYYFDDILLE